MPQCFLGTKGALSRKALWAILSGVFSELADCDPILRRIGVNSKSLQEPYLKLTYIYCYSMQHIKLKLLTINKYINCSE